MDPSEDPEICRLSLRLALLMTFEERMLDAFTEAAAAIRRAGNQEQAAEIEEVIRWHRVDLIKTRATLSQKI